MTASKTSGIGVAIRPLLVLLLLAGSSRTIHAQDSVAAERKVVASISQSEMKDLMEAEGYSASINDDKILIWKIEGICAQMFVAEDEKSIQFHVSFSDGNATLKKVNQWNRSRKYSRTYLDDDGDPHLELDLDIEGGVTEARIIDFLKTCRVVLPVWASEVVK